MDQNPFLKSFLSMRRSLHTAETNGTKGMKKGETKPMADPSGVTMAYIIENKPKEKEVIDYFKARCEALCAD